MSITDPIVYEDAVGLADRLRAVPGVSDLHSGSFGEASLLYPGSRVKGLRLRDQAEGNSPHLEVHVIVDLSAVTTLDELADRVRKVAGEAVPYAVDVIFADATTQAEPHRT